MEENNAMFELERSVDGYTFTTIAQIKGAGNSNRIQSYQWKDLNLQPTIYYYRIKQIDFNGKYSYSAIRSVNLAENKVMAVNEVYPNPFRNDIHIGLTLGNEEKVTVQIANLNGKSVLNSKSQLLGAGDHVVDVDAQQLTAGVYIITVSTQTESFTYKLVK
jgi:uncharacterized protein Usg